MQLPPHVPPADEPIPALLDRPWSGSIDLRTVVPVEEMLLRLREFDDDPVGYVDLWRSVTADAGLGISLMIDRQGERHLMMGGACNGQMRRRNRYQHFLAEDLNADDGQRREALVRALMGEGRYADNRPANPRATTLAIRGYLRTGGRILINPDGRLLEGWGIPHCYVDGTDEERADCVTAVRGYNEVRRRPRSERQIKRAVRMLGNRTENGWLVLERKDAAGSSESPGLAEARA